MDYQEKSNLKIGVSGVGKNYLKMPWSIEDTIENLEELKEMIQKKLIMTNYHGRGEKDADEIAFDFDRAIQALKEDQEYKQLGTLEEVREAMEKQKVVPDINVGEWIPVQERLPEKDEIVLVSQIYSWERFEDCASVTIGRLHPREKNGKPYWEFQYYRPDFKHGTIMDNGIICPGSEYIDAWMPLPKPYRPDFGDE